MRNLNEYLAKYMMETSEKEGRQESVKRRQQIVTNWLTSWEILLLIHLWTYMTKVPMNCLNFLTVIIKAVRLKCYQHSWLLGALSGQFRRNLCNAKTHLKKCLWRVSMTKKNMDVACIDKRNCKVKQFLEYSVDWQHQHRLFYSLTFNLHS